MKKNIAMVSLASIALANVFNNAGWKLDENGNVVLKDGNPVYINASGQEMTLGADTIGRLNGESKAHRERAEAAEASLAKFAGIADPAAALAALETVSKIDQKTLIDAGQVDQVRNQITSQYESQLKEANGKIEALTGRLNNTTLENAFAQSKFVKERIALPADMFRASFEKNFKVDDGKIVAVGPDGNPVYSKAKIGEVADFDEALSILVDNYAHKDQILKAPQQGGSGSDGQGGGRGDGRIVRRSDFEGMSPIDQASLAAKARAGEVQIV